MLDAAQMTLMAADTSPGMNYLFAPSTTSGNTVRRGDKRNVEGQLLYHTMLLKFPWELPVNYRDQVLDLMAEKDPYLITRSQPDPNYPYDEWGEEYISSDRQKALQSIQTTKSSIIVLLNRIHKFTSRTFHVLIRELIPGAKTDKSNLFTMSDQRASESVHDSCQRKRQSCSVHCQKYSRLSTKQVCQKQRQYCSYSMDKDPVAN